jgi:F-type H+-transporting ATPase subunit b
MPAALEMRKAVPCLVAALAAIAVAPCAAWAAEGAGGGIPVGDLGQAVATIVIFLLLLAVLGKWAWKPIVAQLQRREEGIAQTIQHAQEREKQALELLAQYKKQLEAAEAQAAELLSQARRRAAGEQEKLLGQARQESRRLVQSATVEIEQAKIDALRELYDRTAQLAVDVAAKALRQTLRPEDHRRLVEESLREIAQEASPKND